jgi:hypothetical protein
LYIAISNLSSEIGPPSPDFYNLLIMNSLEENNGQDVCVLREAAN